MTKTRIRHWTPIILILLLTGGLTTSCASIGPTVSREELKRKEEEFNLKFLQASEKWTPRVYRVGYRLLTSAVPNHSSKKPELWFAGVGVTELKKYSRKAYGIDKKVSGILVLGTYPGSKAEALDLKLGDIIEKMGDKKTKNLGAYFKSIRKSETPVIKAHLLRGNKRFEVDIPLEKVYYNAQFFLEPTPNFEASSLFSKINVGIGAIRYCRNDDELAAIMGHELAHTTLKHTLKKAGTSLSAGIGYGILAGAIDAFTVQGLGGAITKPIQQATDAAISRRYELEADYFGMQHAFHAGYDVLNGSKAFSRLATDSPGFSVLAQTFASHPVTSERFLRLEKIVEEFKTKYPNKFPLKKATDWEVIIPVGAGETKEEALERLLKEKGVEISKPIVSLDLDQGAEPILQVPEDKAKTSKVDSQVLAVTGNKAAAGGDKRLADFKTSGIDKATPANPDKDPTLAYPEPKKL